MYQRRTALSHLGMSSMNKLTLVFPRITWSRHTHTHVHVSHAELSIIDVSHVHDVPMLQVIAVGETGMRWDEMTCDDVIASVIPLLRRMFPSLDAPVSAHLTHWHASPHYGCYTHTRPGGSRHDYAVLAQSEHERVYFAGEACSQLYNGMLQPPCITLGSAVLVRCEA